MTVISKVIESIFLMYGQKIYIFELTLGIIILMVTLYNMLKRKINSIKLNLGLENKEDREIEENKSGLISVKSVSPFSLTILGIIATIAELTSAVPYFAFLAILLKYELNIVSLIFILLIYNFIYSFPLMVLYFIYKRKEEIFERFYIFIKKQTTKWSVVTLPLVLGIIGIIIVYHSLVNIVS